MPLSGGGGPVDSFGNPKVTIATGLSGLDHWVAAAKAALYPSPTTLAVTASATTQTVTLGSLAMAGPALPDVRAVVIDVWNDVAGTGRTITGATLQFQDTSLGDGTLTLANYPYPITLAIKSQAESPSTAYKRLVFPTPNGVATTPVLVLTYAIGPASGNIVVQAQFLTEALRRTPLDYLWSATFSLSAVAPGSQVLAAPAPPVGTLKSYIVGVQVTNSGTADAVFSLTNGSGGSTLWQANVVHAGAPVSATLNGDDAIPTSANTALFGVSGSASATMVGTITGRYGV